MQKKKERLKRILVTALIFCMVLGQLSPVLANESNVVLGEMGTIGTGGDYNPRGGTRALPDKTYAPYFRVGGSVSRDFKNTGSILDAQKLKNVWAEKGETLLDDRNSMLFQPYNLEAPAKQGVGKYNSGSKTISYNITQEARARIIKLKSPVSNGEHLNVLKNVYKQESTTQGLKGGKWNTGAMSTESALRIWSYILAKDSTGEYHINERMREVISPHLKTPGVDVSKLTAEEKYDIHVGMVSLEVSLHTLAKSRGLDQQAGVYANMIETQLSGVQADLQGAGIMVDTAIPMNLKFGNSTRLFVTIPSADFLYESAKTPSSGVIGMQTGVTSTKERLLRGARESLRQLPLANTKSGEGLLRPSDYAPPTMHSRTREQAALAYNPYIWAGGIPGFSNKKLLVGTGTPQWWSSNHHEIDAGYMEMMAFDKPRGVYGFILAAIQPADVPPEFTWKVDNTNKATLDDNCKGPAEIKEGVQLSFIVKASSTVLATVKAKQLAGEQVVLEMEGQVYRKYRGKEEEIATLSEKISGKVSGENLLSLLKGTPILLKDDTMLGETYTRKVNEGGIVHYTYRMPVKYTLLGKEYDYTDSMKTVAKVGGLTDKPLNYADYILTPGRDAVVEEVEDIIITEPTSADTLDIVNASEIEDTVDSILAGRYTYTSGGEYFSELKEGAPNAETYEAMAGVPSTEEVYFSVGGTEFKLALELQYWMNETGVSRKYQSKFEGTKCEYYNGDNAKTGSIGGKSVNFHTGSTPVKDFSGKIPNNGVADTQTGMGSVSATSVAVPDWSEYNTKLAEANAYIALVNATTRKYTAASDGFTRSQTGWGAHISVNSPRPPQNVTKTASASHTETRTKSDGKGGTTTYSVTIPDPCTATASPAPTGSFTLKVKFRVPSHILCGPC